MLGVLAVVGFLWYGLARLAAATTREITIPLSPGEASAAEVASALERMDCLVVNEEGNPIHGVLPGGLGSWGEEVTVTMELNRLRVRSAFSNSQFFGGHRNQENVDRFRAEWERRAEARALLADETNRAAVEVRSREVARKTVLGGWVAVGIGVAGLAFALLVTPRGASAETSRMRVAGLSLLPLGYGISRLAAARRGRGR